MQNILNKSKNARVITTKVIALGFIFVILVGAFLLKLPISNNGSITFIDALFTATSATCVTGLNTIVPAEQFTFFGQVVILALIQIGGLGFMVFVTLLYILLKRKITLKDRIILGASFGSNHLKGLVGLTKRILKFTFIFESFGALLLAFNFVPKMGPLGIWNAIFLSISSFCNAGFDVLGSDSLALLVNDKFSLIVIAGLIICGGIGFLVWDELNTLFIRKKKDGLSFRKIMKLLSVHAKLVFIMTISLLIIGTCFVMFFEYDNDMTIGKLVLSDKFINSFFLSASSRTAGMCTFSMGELSMVTKMIVCVLMLIGVAPGSTGGGMKITTIAVLFLLTKTIAMNKKHVVVFNKEISQESINKAVCIFLLSISLVFLGVLLLLVTEPSVGLMGILFNVISAISTTGLAIGNIGAWTVFSKSVIIILMYIGRLTTVTMAMAIMDNKTKINDEIRYPEGNIMIG